MTEPSSVRYAWPRSRSVSTSSTICGMWAVARGNLSGVVIRSVAASARNPSMCRAASASIPIPSDAAPRMILSSTSVRFITHVTR